MRITQQSIVAPYLRSLEEAQNKKFQEQIKLSSGKNILSLSDDPKNIISSKQLTTVIDRNVKYQNNIDTALNEMMMVNEQLVNVSDNFQKIRQLTVDATQVGNAGNSFTLAQNVKGILDDILKTANTDFNGQFLFSGTQTTSESLTTNGTTHFPFELVQETPTTDNPSGMKVVFNGNFKDRIINKDSKSSESMNVKANEMFGAGGTEVFNSIIGLYNSLKFNPDGTPRNDIDQMSREDIQKLNDHQAQIQKICIGVDNVNAQNGARINRLTALTEQMTEENTRLKEFRSRMEDTDAASSAIRLAEADNTLKYVLQIGSRLNSETLLDFLR